ncbi:hypothetical protein ACFQ40_00140 [Kroppenstedtia eburnea]|uniref:hypothetical protein n=2 Tax=Bacillati TaxID=1783272 RepID=UPI00362A46AD
MRTFYQMGAMYARIEEGDQIDTSPIELGDGILHPGEWVWKIGEKARTSFEMNKGYYLRFVGSGWEGDRRVLLFDVNRSECSEYCYAFSYADRHTLVIGRGNKFNDIRIQYLQKFTELPADAVEIKEEKKVEQLTLF